jgi:hypothetical protein
MVNRWTEPEDIVDVINEIREEGAQADLPAAIERAKRQGRQEGAQYVINRIVMDLQDVASFDWNRPAEENKEITGEG